MKKLTISLLALILFQSCKNAYVLDIPAIKLEKGAGLSFGSRGDVILPSVKDTVFELLPAVENKSIRWRMKSPIYVRVDGQTLNRVNLDTVEKLQAGRFTLTKSELIAAGRPFAGDRDKVRYIGIKDIFCSLNPGVAGEFEQIASLFACNASDNSIIILDTLIHLFTNAGSITSWKQSGEMPKQTAKIAFFNVLTFKPVGFTQNGDYFSIKDTSFISRVKPLYSSFGCDIVNISVTDNRYNVTFNKPWRAVFDRSLLESKEKPLSIAQELSNYQSGSYIYTDNFSWHFPGTLAYIDSSNKIIHSEEDKFPGLRFFETGLNTNLVLSYSPLILVYLIGVFWILIFFFNRIFATEFFFFEITSANKEFRNWRRYYLIIFSILFSLLSIRQFIGYNLSFNYPYFPFAYDIDTAISPVILLSVLLIYAIIWKYNFPDLSVRKWMFLPLSIFACVLISGHVLLFRATYLSAWQDALNGLKSCKPYNLALLATTLSCPLLAIPLVCPVLRKKVMKFVVPVISLLSSISIYLFFNNAASAAVVPWFILAFSLSAFVPYRYLFIKPGITLGKRLLRGVIGLVILIAVPVILLVVKNGDAGYLITLPLFIFSLFIILILFYRYYSKADLREESRLLKNSIWTGLLVLALFSTVFCFYVYYSGKYDPENSTRFTARVTAMYKFDKVREFGYNETERIAQFFAILGKYSIPIDHPVAEPMHATVSSFVDPVIKNDLSVPYAYIYSSGSFWKYALAFLCILLVLLFWQGFTMAVSPGGSPMDYRYYFTGYALLRLMAVSIVCGTGCWLLLSYYGLVPFTGRLMYGLGQDSLAEVIETISWFGLMGLVGPYQKSD